MRPFRATRARRCELQGHTGCSGVRPGQLAVRWKRHRYAHAECVARAEADLAAAWPAVVAMAEQVAEAMVRIRVHVQPMLQQVQATIAQLGLVQQERQQW